jgi:hypothetical protein
MTTAFIVRPFGEKTFRSSGADIKVDFDRIERDLIDPALTRLGITGRTTGEIVEAGNIRDDMFFLLLTRDLVVADVSIHNANVFYELGIRHALRDRWTVLIRCKGDPMPFDNLTDRYLEYDKDNPGASVDKLAEAIQSTLEAKGKDSPVFRSLPNLQPPNVDGFIVIPSDFGGEVELARDTRQVGDLLLLASEAQGFPWEVEGLRAVGRALFKLNAMRPARGVWETVLDLRPNDLEASELLGTVYQRLGERAKPNEVDEKAKLLSRSNQVLEQVLADPELDVRKRAELHSLIARNHKSRWRDDWKDKAEGRREAALGSKFLRESCEAYAQAFRVDLNHHYSGLNAAAMLTVLTSLARALPKKWAARFRSDREGTAELEEREGQLKKLLVAVALSLEAERERLKVKPNRDARIWLDISFADLDLLTLEGRPEAVEEAYRGALQDAESFHRESAAKQLLLYQELGLMAENVQAALAAVSAHISPAKVDPRVLLFTGHRMDAPGRDRPRFPADKEEVARKAIADAVDKEMAQAARDGQKLVGIAGGASGGDILFHEICREKGIESTLYLVMPRSPFITASVQDAGGEWMTRFDALARTLPKRELMSSAELPAWLRKKPQYTVWDRSNLWMLHNAFVHGGENATLIALWDGGAGDGPGGTEHMVREARARGSRVIPLDTRALFKLGG